MAYELQAQGVFTHPMNVKKHLLLLLLTCFVLSTGFSQRTEFMKSFDGVDIAYKVYGEGDTPLIFVHGWCCDKSYWKEQVNFFKTQFKIVTIDLAGHGESGLGRDSYTIQGFAKDITTVINHLGLNDIILIGHSMGVNVILETAINNLENTRALFPIDGFREIPKVKTEEELKELEKEDRSGWKADRFQEQVYNWVRMGHHPKSDSTLIDSIAKDMSFNDPFVGIDAIVNSMQYYYSVFPKSLKLIGDIPVINIASTGKPNVDEFREYGVNFQDFQMEGFSHFLMMSHPDAFNEVFSKQLQNLPSRK